MKLLTRYIGSTVLWSIAMICLVFVGLEIFIMFITELSDIGRGDYGLWESFLYVLCLMPKNLYALFPVMGLLGSVIGLGVLATTSELTVMRASGVSILQVAGSVLRVAIIVLCIATFFGEVIGPYLMRFGEQHREMSMSGGQTLVTVSGVWVRSGNEFIHIAKVLGHDHLQDVTVYAFADDHRLTTVTTSAHVDYFDNLWVMRQVKETHFTQERVTTQSFDRKVLDIDFSPEIFKLGYDEPGSMSLPKLHQFIQYRLDNGLEVSNYQLAFWKRLYQPLATMVMMFLAIPFIFFGSLRTITMGFRVMVGVLVGLGFFMFNELLGQFSIVFRMPAAFAALLPILLFGLLGYALIKRAR